MRACEEVSAAVALLDLTQLENHTYHAGMDLAVLGAVPEDRVDLLRPATVQIAVPLALLAHHAARGLEADLSPDELLDHPDD